MPVPPACLPSLAAKAYLDGIRTMAAEDDDADDAGGDAAAGLDDDELGERLKEEALEVLN